MPCPAALSPALLHRQVMERLRAAGYRVVTSADVFPEALRAEGREMRALVEYFVGMEANRWGSRVLGGGAVWASRVWAWRRAGGAVWASWRVGMETCRRGRVGVTACGHGCGQVPKQSATETVLGVSGPLETNHVVCLPHQYSQFESRSGRAQGSSPGRAPAPSTGTGRRQHLSSSLPPPPRLRHRVPGKGATGYQHHVMDLHNPTVAAGSLATRCPPSPRCRS